MKRVLSFEVDLLPNDATIRYPAANISLADGELFVIDNITYDKVSIVLGEDKTHWVFVKMEPKLKLVCGSGILPCSYCYCCINDHIVKILKCIKEHAVKEQ